MTSRTGTPREWVTRACERHGVDVVVADSAALLSGADPTSVRIALDDLGGAGSDRYVADHWPAAAYWPRVWGARAFRYAWLEDTDDGRAAARAVVAGLADEHWRVREMCAKVVALHEIGEAAPALLRLLHDETPRVRAAAVGALAVVGEHEHVEPLTDAGDDPEPAVAAAAERALATLRRRIDLV